MNGVIQSDALTNLKEEYNVLQSKHSELKKLREDVRNLEKTCVTSSEKQLKKLTSLRKQLGSSQDVSVKEVFDMQTKLTSIRETLPQPNNLFLRSIVGSINVTIPNGEDKLVYKERYENFKRNALIIIISLTFLCFWFKDYTRLPESFLQFMLAWFYLALTVREHILIKNGSKIATWWVLHHYFSITISGIFLIWPDGECYRNFQMQFLYFTLTIAGIMYLQFIYQKGQLYKLRTLGKAHKMDFVQDSGIRTRSMGSDLYFLIPFLLSTYLFQLYNSYKLYTMHYLQECQYFWQVPTLCMLFLVIAVGNTWTLVLVLIRKCK